MPDEPAPDPPDERSPSTHEERLAWSREQARLRDEPEPRRSWIRVSIDRSTSFKTTLFKFAPSLRIGTLFGSPLRAAITTAVIIGGPAAGIMAAETTGATDLLDQDPQAVHITVLADETGQVTIASDPALESLTVFDELKAAIEAIASPTVTVTVLPMTPETVQTLIQIGTILDRLPVFFGSVTASITGLRADIAALGSGDAEALALLRAIAAAIFPPGQGCPACPESIPGEE
jgi:hypothetical protein